MVYFNLNLSVNGKGSHFESLISLPDTPSSIQSILQRWFGYNPGLFNPEGDINVFRYFITMKNRQHLQPTSDIPSDI